MRHLPSARVSLRAPPGSREPRAAGIGSALGGAGPRGETEAREWSCQRPRGNPGASRPTPELGGGLWPAGVRDPGRLALERLFARVSVFVFFKPSRRVLSSALPPPRGSVPCRGNTKPRPRPKRFYFSGDEQKSSANPAAPRGGLHADAHTMDPAASSQPGLLPGPPGRESGLRGPRVGNSPSAALVRASPAPSPGRLSCFQSFMNFQGRKTS